MGCLLGLKSGWSVTGMLAQDRGGGKAPILSSLLFLVHNWSHVCQSSRTCPLSFSQGEGQGEETEPSKGEFPLEQERPQESGFSAVRCGRELRELPV